MAEWHGHEGGSEPRPMGMRQPQPAVMEPPLDPLLREIIARRRRDGSPLHALRLWTYAHPVPFDEELADLLAEAGCKGVSLSAEHMGREGLAAIMGRAR